MRQAANHPLTIRYVLSSPFLPLHCAAIVAGWCHGIYALTPTGSVFYLVVPVHEC